MRAALSNVMAVRAGRVMTKEELEWAAPRSTFALALFWLFLRHLVRNSIMRCVVMLYWWCTSNASTVFIIFGEMGMSWEARGTWFQRYQYECSKKGGGGDGSLAELYSVRTYAEFLECPEGKYVTQPFQPHIWYSCGGALLLVNMFPSLVWLLGDGSTVGATVVVLGFHFNLFLLTVFLPSWFRIPDFSDQRPPSRAERRALERAAERRAERRASRRAHTPRR